MSEDVEQIEVDFDEPCEKCGYNLRGLRVGGKCPECEHVIPPAFPPEADQDPLVPFHPIADRLHRSVEAVMFVWNVLGFASNRAIRAGRRAGQFDAQELGWCLRDYVHQECASIETARAQLAGWGLTRSEEFRAVVVEIVKAEIWKDLCLNRIEDFDGLFEIDALLRG
jgi:uncharacterized repeat protein (TIGR04138 family)